MGKSMQSKVLSGCMPAFSCSEIKANKRMKETPRFRAIQRKAPTFGGLRAFCHHHGALNLAPKVREDRFFCAHEESS
jgi:hypothetical protein